VLQCVAGAAVCLSVLYCVAVCCSVLQFIERRLACHELQHAPGRVLQLRVAVCVAVYVCCSVLQCACCSVCVLQSRVAVCCSVLQCAAARCSVLQCVAVCCSALQCTAACCSVLQCVAV